MYKRFFIFTFAAIMLTGCSFKPATPQKDTSFDFGYAASNINEVWWKNFNDDILNKLVEEALKHNSDLALALNNIEYARVSLGLSKLEFLPNISYSADAKRQNNNIMGHDANSHANYSVNAILNYELDLWGRVRNSMKSARSKYFSTKYDYDLARLSIASSVANTYFNLVSLTQQEEILKSTLKSYENTLNFRANQLNAGVISNIIYYQAKTQVDSAKSQLIGVQNQISNTNTALFVLTGNNYNDIIHKKIQPNTEFANIPEIPEGIPSDILLHRADVASALEKLRATNFLVGVAKARYFPTFSLTGVFGYTSKEFDRLFVENANVWNVGGSLVGPLLDFGRTKKSVELANLEQNASFINYDKTLKNAFADVKDALANRQNLKLKQVNVKNLVDSRQKVYDMASQRYEQGYSDHLELLDSQRMLLSAKLDLARANFEVISSVVGVYKALGGGFKLQDSAVKEMIISNKTVLPTNSSSPFRK